jgi:hypothetical protein
MSRQSSSWRLAALLGLAFAGMVFQQSTAMGAGGAIVFASRDLAADPDSTTRASAIEKARSGRLLVLEADGRVRTLVDAGAPGADPQAPVDVIDPDVSWDGARIAFAGYSKSEAAWRIYEIGADGTGLRQITRSDRRLDLTPFGAAAEHLRSYDDIDPCYLPDGRVCFVSTRYPAIAPDGRRLGTNLYVVNANGSDLHRITSERFGADTPTVDLTTGKIVYSRWWRSPQFALESTGGDEQDSEPEVDPGSPDYAGVLPTPEDAEPVPPIRAELTDGEFPGLNNWFLADINPDGTGMAMLSGMGLDRQQTQAWKPSIRADGSMVALFIPRTPFLGLPRGDGLRLVERGAVAPSPIGGPQSFALEGSAFDFVYAGAEPLPDGRLLVSAAASASPRDYDIYTQKVDGAAPVRLYGQRGWSETGAVLLAPRPQPPLIADSAQRLSDQPPRTVEEAFQRGGSFTFLVENIFGNAPVGMPIANAPPVGTDLTIEFFMNPQRSGVTTPDEPILVARRDIDSSGRIEVKLPGGVPLFEVLRTSAGLIPVGRDGQIFHVGGHNFGNAGKTARCIGCHVGHSMLDVPADPAWTNLATSADVVASSARRVTGEDDIVSRQRPENLVDRRISGLRSEWAAESTSASLELKWPLPIRTRELVIYGTAPGEGTMGPRAQTIRSLRVITLLNGEKRGDLLVQGGISPAGTRVPIDATRPINRVQLVILASDVEGLYEGRPGPALAEIEVIARIAESDGPITYVRGDSNCDGAVHISDGIATLGWLFQGPASACCQAAMDTDGGGRVDLSDAIGLFNFLFLGGPPPALPFPECGIDEASPLSCDGPTACR